MIWRIISIVGVAMWLMSCQSSTTADTPTTTVSDSTTAPVALEPPASPDESDAQGDAADVPVATTSQDAQVVATATPRRLRLVASATAIKTGGLPPPTGQSDAEGQATASGAAGLQWESVAGVNDDAACVIALVVGVSTDGWVMQIDDSVLFAEFTGFGTAAVCGIAAGQAVTATIFDANDMIVPGSQSVPTRGGDALYGKWVDGGGSTSADAGTSTDESGDDTRGLRFRLDNSDANQRCIVVTVSGIGTGGWLIKGDGLKVNAAFDDNGVAELCGLNRRQEFTFSVYDAKAMQVTGGTGISARGGDAFVAEWGDIAGAQQAPTATSAPVADNRALRVALKNSDDDPKCISVQVRGIRTSGWVLRADGLKLSANFDGAGNARLCGLARQQEFTFSVFTAKGGAVAGGSGIPARGGNIFVADWL